uniref:Calcineurin-like phosphoesterase domain-containing protein n=1 Tax=viral metagenome TaxID=1070528 RepID=A0A6M3KCU1_9ZZZZ
MEITEFLPQTRKSLTLPWEECLVMPVGDVQFEKGDKNDRLRRHIEWGVKQGAYFLGMGDYVDVMSPSNRESWRAMRKYDSVQKAMDEKAEEHVEGFLNLISGSEGRWLGLLEGHHFYEFDDGTTSDTRIAQALKTTFLGTCAAVVLRFKRDKTNTALRCIIWCHHGMGSSRMQSGPITRLEHIMPYFEADFYLMGHMTKKPAAPVPRIYISDQEPYRLISKKKYLVGTGGFTQGYKQGATQGGRPRGGFVERGMMPPVALGGPVLKIRPVREAVGGRDTARLDLNVEV